MRKFILIFVLLSSFVFSTTIDSVAKKNINDTLSLLHDKDANIVNKLLTSSDAVYGEYTSENYKYIYKLKVSGGDRIGIFIIKEIYNENYPIIKELDMKNGFVILINGQANKKVIFAGNMNSGGGEDINDLDNLNSDKQQETTIIFDKSINENFNSKNIEDNDYDYDTYIFSTTEDGKITIDFTKSDNLAYAYITSFSRKRVLNKHLLHRDKVSLDIKSGFYKLTLRSQGKIATLGKIYPYQFTMSCLNENGYVCTSINDDAPNNFFEAESIKLGKVEKKKIDYQGDFDYFKFYIPKDDLYDIFVFNSDIITSLTNNEGKNINANCRNHETENKQQCRNYLRKGTYYLIFQKDLSSETPYPEYEFTLKCFDSECSNSNDESSIRFPLDEDDWIVTMGSSCHKEFNHKNDTFSLDLGLYNDEDKGKKVYPILDGEVHSFTENLGALVIKHTNNDTYKYSLYMHMSNIPDTLKVIGKEVTKETVLGKISNIGTLSNHLHFTAYKDNRTNPVDMANEFPIEWVDNIKTWISQCDPTNENRIKYNESSVSPWWTLGELPCTKHPADGVCP